MNKASKKVWNLSWLKAALPPQINIQLTQDSPGVLSWTERGPIIFTHARTLRPSIHTSKRGAGSCLFYTCLSRDFYAMPQELLNAPISTGAEIVKQWPCAGQSNMSTLIYCQKRLHFQKFSSYNSSWKRLQALKKQAVKYVSVMSEMDYYFQLLLTDIFPSLF